MARKAVVDKDVILNMLREGKTTQYIAEEFGVSRQAIDLHRRDFIKGGLIPDQRAGRVKKAVERTAPPRPASVSPEGSMPPQHAVVSLDEQIDLIINAFSALKRLPELEAEFETYKRKYESAQQEIERLRDADKKRRDQENRWLLTQPGDTATSPEKSSRDGEH
ncbi:hypothetical protein ACFLW0_01035 [Chloroflexota bacterium]